jgi:type II secretory pathway component PulF
MLAVARREALQAMAYPVALLHLGLFVAVVAPGLMAGGKGFGGLLIQFLLVLAALYAGLFLTGLAVRTVLAAAPERPVLEHGIGRIPVLGSARRSMAMARFTKVYHTCLLAGLSMKETVETACTASHNGVIREAGRRLQAALDEGSALGPVFLASDAFPPAFARSYATAEESGGLDKDLGRWADFFQDEAARRVRTASAVISKAVYFAVLLFVAWTIIRSYTARYNEMFEMLDD